jgi:3',5'-cyclic AMP phosphodiesterase CpdA
MCNSAFATAPFFATGFFSVRQAENLEKLLREEGDEGRCRVVLIHHPPVSGATSFHKRLIGANYFRQAVAGAGAEIVLHGHTHQDSLIMIDGRDGPVPVAGVPSAVQVTGGKHPAARYNMLSIGRSPGKSNVRWSITHEEFGYVVDFPGVRQIGQARVL